MTRVFIHPLAGVLSAYGMGLADVRALRQQALETPLDREALAACDQTFEPLETAARNEVAEQRIPTGNITLRRTLHIKYDGTDTALEIDFSMEPASIVETFERLYRARYGFLMPNKALIIEAVAVEASGRTQDAEDEQWPLAEHASVNPQALAATRIFSGGEWRDTLSLIAMRWRPARVSTAQL